MSPWVSPPPILPASLNVQGLADQIERMPSRQALLVCFIFCFKSHSTLLNWKGSSYLWLGKGADPKVSWLWVSTQCCYSKSLFVNYTLRNPGGLLGPHQGGMLQYRLGIVSPLRSVPLSPSHLNQNYSESHFSTEATETEPGFSWRNTQWNVFSPIQWYGLLEIHFSQTTGNLPVHSLYLSWEQSRALIKILSWLPRYRRMTSGRRWGAWWESPILGLCTASKSTNYLISWSTW